MKEEINLRLNAARILAIKLGRGNEVNEDTSYTYEISEDGNYWFTFSDQSWEQDISVFIMNFQIDDYLNQSQQETNSKNHPYVKSFKTQNWRSICHGTNALEIEGIGCIVERFFEDTNNTMVFVPGTKLVKNKDGNTYSIVATSIEDVF